MTATPRNVAATRSMLLELKEEERFTREGHEFLDQKRMLLAGALLDRVAEQATLRRRLLDAHERARDALANAVARHGLEELSVHPTAHFDPGEVRETENFLGVRLAHRISEPRQESAASDFANPSPEARRAIERFSSLLSLAVDLALVEANIERLLNEYRRTERRARALENVILPELRLTTASIDEKLEEQDQEEATLVRRTRRSPE